MNEESDAQDQPEAAPAEALEAELAKARDDMLRALAEVENTRRRAERQVQDARAYAIDRFAADLLPVADTLGRALSAAPEGWRESADDGLRNLLTGLELTERSLLEAFSRNGLKRVGAKGETFDPNRHQAVAQIPSSEPQGAIAEVMQPGYVLGDRTVRPAMVAVSSGGNATEDAKEEPGESQHVDIKI